MELAAGLLIIFVGVVHIVYGERQPLAALGLLTSDQTLIGSVRVMSLQGGILLLAVGAVHLLSFFDLIALTGFTAWIPLGIICLNLLTFLITALVKHRELLAISGVQLLLFAAIIALQALVLAGR
ncbi:hypothetical protein JW859_14750 [bacterium]|nr:hypothetical protein [bacterium]